MKNIESILAENGIEGEVATSISKAVGENYKTISEFEKKDAKIATLTEKVQATEEALKAFDGIDAEGMKKQIADLTQSLADKDAEYSKKIADRDFNELLNASIAEHKGKNAKAITALLDVETLKASKNQKEDIASAIKTLSEAEDSKMLFDAGTPQGSAIGQIQNRHTTTIARDDKYKDNPYYHPKN